MRIARALGHPAYDCFYMALAEREGCALVTTDTRSAKAVEGTAWDSTVVTLADLPPLPA